MMQVVPEATSTLPELKVCKQIGRIMSVNTMVWLTRIRAMSLANVLCETYVAFQKQKQPFYFQIALSAFHRLMKALKQTIW